MGSVYDYPAFMIIISDMAREMQLVGARIAATRKALGLTQIELGELAGISYRPVYLIESGRSIRLDSLVRICDVLGLEVALTPRGGMRLDGS